jgi:hypothetical protein
MKDLNEVIEPKLAEKKLSKRAFAERIGLTEAGFHRILVRNDCKVSDLEKMAENLDVPTTVFFYDEKSIVEEKFAEWKREKESMKTTIENLLNTVKVMSLGKFSPVLQAVA